MFAFHEIPDSRRSTMEPTSLTLRYYAGGNGDNDNSFVHAYALAATPLQLATPHGTIFRQDIEIESIGWDAWHINVPYAKRKKENGQWDWSFRSSGGTIRITGGKHKAVFPAGKPTHNGLIGVNGEEVEGVDVVVPATIYDFSFRHPQGVVSLSYSKAISDMTGVVNSDNWLAFGPGEMLFLGPNGSDGSNSEAQLSYSFAYSKTVSNLQVGDIAIVNKQGHDVAWITYKKEVQNNLPAQVPDYVNIVEVYRRYEFSSIFPF